MIDRANAPTDEKLIAVNAHLASKAQYAQRWQRVVEASLLPDDVLARRLQLPDPIEYRTQSNKGGQSCPGLMQAIRCTLLPREMFDRMITLTMFWLIIGGRSPSAACLASRLE
jgi:hypothetical protein